MQTPKLKDRDSGGVTEKQLETAENAVRARNEQCRPTEKLELVREEEGQAKGYLGEDITGR